MTEETGERAFVAEALNALATTLLLTAELAGALARAEEIAAEIGDRYELADAHAFTAEIHHARGHRRTVNDHWHMALDRYTSPPDTTTPLVTAVL